MISIDRCRETKKWGGYLGIIVHMSRVKANACRSEEKKEEGHKNTSCREVKR
jgi:hypothetical protein